MAATDGPGSDPGGARGSAALTSACTAARRASRMAGSRPSPLALLPVAAVVVVVVTPDVVVPLDQPSKISLSAAQVELMPKVRAKWSVLLYRRPALPTHARYPSTVHNAVA